MHEFFSILKAGGSKELNIRRTLSLVFKKYNVFEHYGVDKFLHTNAFLVTPKYRGRRISKYMLSVNKKICAEFDITMALTVLTSNAANRITQKAGYTVDRAFRYLNNNSLSFI